jgi:hypothetical protein
MLAVCVSEYWGFADIGVDERYVEWSVGALLGYLLILVALAWDANRPPHDGAAAPATPGPKMPEVPEAASAGA